MNLKKLNKKKKRHIRLGFISDFFFSMNDSYLIFKKEKDLFEYFKTEINKIGVIYSIKLLVIITSSTSEQNPLLTRSS